MVEKMKLLHITGHKEDIDRMMKVYLNKYDIHFENAMTNLGNQRNIHPFMETNVYKDVYQMGQELETYLEHAKPVLNEKLTLGQADNFLRTLYQEVKELQDRQSLIKNEIQKKQEWMVLIEPFTGLDFELKKMKDFHFIDYQFGRITLDNYHKLQHHIYHNPYTMFYECNSDSEYVWGVYFVPHIHKIELEAIYASFHFEDISLPDDFEGNPGEVYDAEARQLQDLESQWLKLQEEITAIVKGQDQSISDACECVKNYCDNFEIRKYAACIQADANEGEFYILYGWMSEKDSIKFQKQIEGDEYVFCIEEEADERLSTGPPTKLKNPKILKPFELFVEMYGLPAYNEMDPTLFVALTYTLMFGVMFGDVGQGLALVIGGFIVYKKKGMRLAGVISVAGLWSVFFGFMYGSVFGFEEWLPAIWMKPMHNIMSTLMIAIGFGAALIMIAMVLNMINAVRAKEYGRLLFHQSGLAGLICYGFVALCAILLITGHGMPAAILIGIAVVVPMIAIILKDPLSHLIERRGKVLPEGSKVMFVVEALVEGFDVVLSYATNTISFVRVGAFALSHAGMMGVVLTLSGFEKGDPNWLIIILGNILVAGLEGLVVGIQVLRLEYYEMFSRFYKGSGKPFISFKNRNQ